MRAQRSILAVATVLILVASASSAVIAADAFYDIPIKDLKITAGHLPNDYAGVDPSSRVKRDQRWIVAALRVIIDGPGEGYIDDTSNQATYSTIGEWNELSNGHVLIRAPQGQEVHGHVFLPKPDEAAMERVAFTVPAAAANDRAQQKFYEAKLKYCQSLSTQFTTIAGTPWFRHEFNQTIDKLDDKDRKKRWLDEVQSTISFRPASDDAYDLFSGGRAVSESLQLDRQLRERAQNKKSDVEISSLTGITVATINWKPLLKGADPKLDPLSKLIPADQHALFIPSFAAATKLQDESKGRDSLLLDLAKPESENLDIAGRYQRQLGLSLTDLGRIVGQAAIKSLAVTGSDSYFPTGTDVAVLFETDHPDVLAGLLKAQIDLSATKHADAKPQNGETGGVKYQGVRSPNRQICSYIAQLNGAVVVTNSLAQLERLAKVGKDIDPISSLDEFKFFRTRYPLGDKDETAFLFLSDATIRRWCSPQWRIASARRIFTAAEMAELTAENIQALGTGKANDEVLHSEIPLIDAGELKLKAGGVSSSTQGTLEFMTPIVEMPIAKITDEESFAYSQWRDRYQSNWRWAFDPIGFRIGVADTKLSGDLTVMPLIAGSEYREFINLSHGAKITPDSGDRHDTLANVILAINPKSETMQQWRSTASMFAPQAHIDPFSWLGSSVSLYVDDDPVWKKIREIPPDKREEEMSHLWGSLPVALQFEVSSPLKLTAFLTALRAFAEQSAPGMTDWQALKYRDVPYVQIKPTQSGRRGLGQDADVSVYYSPSADDLIVTLNETVLKHAIDRRLAREAAAKNDSKNGDKKKDVAAANGKAADVAKESLMSWLGESFCLQVDHRMMEILNGSLGGIVGGQNQLSDSAMQLRSWSNIPILNEWKRLFPDDDPVKIHERLWHTTLVDPAGGKYVWNSEWKTMESTIYGHPGQPKSGPAGSAAIEQFQTANFGLTFEEQGLRAKVELAREPEKK